MIIAKNYLNEAELDLLNRVVSFYLDFAELRAIQKKPMYMQDWIKKLDEFLKLSEQSILTHAGKISHEAAVEQAYQEFEKYHHLQLNAPSRAEQDFEEVLQKLEEIEKAKK